MWVPPSGSSSWRAFWLPGSREVTLRWVAVAKVAVGYSEVDGVCGFGRAGVVGDGVAVAPTTGSPSS